MINKYALVIGNTEYNDAGLARLRAPGRDAEDFERVLKHPEICAFDQVKVLLNEASFTIIEAIDEFFDEKRPDDLLVLYFSGHGVRDELGSLYLAVKNTIRSRLRSTAIRTDYIREAMDQSRSKRQVVILDCCNSGAFPQGAKADVGGPMGMGTALQGYGRFVLTASDTTQFAWEGDQILGEAQNSLFTHFLVKGLEGEADGNSDGSITVSELYDYAYAQVSSLTPNQKPTKSASKQEGEIILRQITRLEDIKPVALSDQLIGEIENPYPEVRLRAVEQLSKLLIGKSVGIARSARQALEKIEKEDDSRRVSRAATQSLEAVRQAEQLALRIAEEKRLAAEKLEAARKVLEKAETEQKAKEGGEPLAEATRLQSARVAAARKVKEAERSGRAKANQNQTRQARTNGLPEQKVHETPSPGEHMRVEQKDSEASAQSVTSQTQSSQTFRTSKVGAEVLAPETGKEKQIARENKRPTPWKRIFVGVGILVVFAGVIASVIAYNNEMSSRRYFQGLATQQAREEATANAQKQNAFAQLSQAWTWPLIFMHEFNTNDIVWSTGNLDSSLLAGNRLLVDGKYRWDVKALNSFYWWDTVSPNIASSYYVAVDGKRISGSRNTGFAYGLVLRQKDRNNFYIFLIDADSRWRFSRWYNDQLTALDSDWSDAIQAGSVNRLEVIVSGSQFILFINDQYVGEVNDTQVSGATFGMVVSLDEAGDEASFEFDNFQLRSPDMVSSITSTPAMLSTPSAFPTVPFFFATPTP